jgi:flagellar motor switch protein FliN/FliY
MSSSPSSSSSSDRRAVEADPLDWVMDVPCPVDFVLGTATVKVRQAAEFALGTVVRLRRAAGSDLDIRVAGVPIATGQVVIVDENVGLRLNRILPPGYQEPA